MVELRKNELVFQFPEVHKNAICRVSFQRTLRIPDDNQLHSLPPSLGSFPVAHVEDHASRLPQSWVEHGGVLLPMHQSEALWINFSGGLSFSSGANLGSEPSYPFAVKIATGKINAVTGRKWKNELAEDPQDYLVLPEQPWLDGFCMQEGMVRQFVAMPLGQGYTAEEQISGEAEHGGIQIIVYPMKREYYERMLAPQTETIQTEWQVHCCKMSEACSTMEPNFAMGIAPGGLVRQEIYEDEYGYDAWDMSKSSRCFVHLLNSEQWTDITDQPVPSKPPSARDYTKAGLPWFEYYDDKLTALKGGKKLRKMDSVAGKGVKLGKAPFEEDSGVGPKTIVQLKPKSPRVSEGNW